MFKRKKNEVGMSLVEILIATSIFIIGAVSVIYLHISTQISLNYTLEKSQAMLLAKEGIEEQRKTRNNSGLDFLTPEVDNVITMNDIVFTRDVGVNVTEGRATITSTVTWKEGESVSFTEIITNWKYE